MGSIIITPIDVLCKKKWSSPLEIKLKLTIKSQSRYLSYIKTNTVKLCASKLELTNLKNN